MSKDKKIGEVLLEKRLIDKEALDAALQKQQIDQSKIGKILMSENIVRPLAFHRAIATKFGVEFVDLSIDEPNAKLINATQKHNYFSMEVIPWRENKEAITIACSDISADVRAWAIKQYPYKQINFVITSPLDILWSLQKFFEKDDNENALFGLKKKLPNMSAQKLFSQLGAAVFIFGIFALAAIFVNFPQASFTSFLVLLNILFFTTISFKSFAFIISLFRQKDNIITEILPNPLPIYTILIPLYKERGSIANLINAIDAFDYPKSKLDVKLVVETDDKETIQIIKKLAPPAYFEIIKTPYSLPRTKPKACNYALQYIRGEFVTIFDAEDIPNKYQLKTVLAKFQQGGKKMACVQARLNYYNYSDSQITRWFALEYAIWFDYVMRGLEMMKLAIPLGGTSNHIRSSTLLELGGWDPFNVTEDADLGMRLKRFGYSVGAVDSVTMEEATSSIRAWILQRKRWIKGFMQTYIVHMRQPIRFIREAGFGSFLTLLFFIGFPPIIYLLSPLALILTLSSFSFASNILTLPEWLYDISMMNLYYSILTHIAFALLANYRSSNNNRRMFKPMILSAITYPFYNILHVFASFGSLRELIFKPHYWEKTQHGITKTKPEDSNND
jgi:cellulose synthase/poly-beta-1,6-N-acetylglucosamine synthase-like glycosyltransferase